jgi:hypothetical protein
MGKRWRILAVLSATVLAACSRSEPLSESDAGVVLQAYYDQHPSCLSLAIHFPAQLVRTPGSIAGQQFDALVKAGLVAQSEAAVTEVGIITRNTRTVMHRTYKLTVLGEGAIHPGPDKFLGGSQLCFAKRQVAAVISIQRLESGDGVAKVAVAYTYTNVPIAAWAQDPVVRVAYPGIDRVLDEKNRAGRDVVQQSEAGWVRVAQ